MKNTISVETECVCVTIVTIVTMVCDHCDHGV